MIDYIRVGRTGKLATITWVLGNYCNWDCSYCWPATHKGDVPMPKWTDDYNDNLKHIIKQFKGYTLRWVLTGGEPTLYSDIRKMVTTIREASPDSEIICQTNASRTVRWWQDNCDLFDGIWLTAHTEFTDIEHTIKVMETCLASTNNSYQKNYSISFNLAAHPKDPIKVKGIVDRLKLWVDSNPTNNRLRLMIKPLDMGRYKPGDGEYEMYNYGYMYKRYIEEVNSKPFQSQYSTKNTTIQHVIETEDGTVTPTTGERIIASNPRYPNWLCNAHKEWLMIDKNGDLSINCGFPVYDREYNFYEPHAKFKTFSIPEKSITCDGRACQCLGLYLTSKINNSNYNVEKYPEFKNE